MYTLSNRGALAATDGSPVVDTAQFFPKQVRIAVVTCVVVTTGAPATFNYRAAVEVSPDGVNWEQVIRFTDFTAVGMQVARMMGATLISDATGAVSALTGAAASPVLIDTPWPRYIRAVTMLQAMTGGASPTVAGYIELDVGN